MSGDYQDAATFGGTSKEKLERAIGAFILKAMHATYEAEGGSAYLPRRRYELLDMTPNDLDAYRLELKQI